MSGLVTLFRSLRCSYCNVCWPNDERYDPCPLCHESTEGSITSPITQEEAVAAAREYGFGWWLWENGRL